MSVDIGGVCLLTDEPCDEKREKITILDEISVILAERS